MKNRVRVKRQTYKEKEIEEEIERERERERERDKKMDRKSTIQSEVIDIQSPILASSPRQEGSEWSI